MNDYPGACTSIFAHLAKVSGVLPVHPRRRSAAVNSARHLAGAMLERLEARELMAVDLGIELGDSYAPLNFYVPGESIAVPYAIRNNNGLASFTGRGELTLTLTRAGTSETTNIVVTTTLNSLAPDATRAGTASFIVPLDLAPGSFSLTFSLAAQNSSGGVLSDEAPQDNTLTADTNIGVRWVVGTVSPRFNVVLKLIDADGTRYSITQSGGGFSEILDEGGTPTLLIRGVANGVTPVAQRITFAVLPNGAPDSDAFIDLPFAIRTAMGGSTLIGAINGAAMNLTASMQLGYGDTTTGFVQLSATNASTAITLRNLAGTGDLAGNFIFGNIGAMTVGTITGTVRVLGNTGPTRATAVATDAELHIDGNAASLAIGNTATPLITAVGISSIYVGGNVGALSMGTIVAVDPDFPGAFASITVVGTAGATTFADVTGADIILRRTVTSLTVRDMTNSSISINRDGLATRTNIPVTMRTVTNSSLLTEAQLSTVTVRNWIDLPDAAPSKLLARAITTLTLGAATTAGTGNFDATVFISGGISRPTQLGTATFNGVLKGSIFVGGSVGTFTARAIDTGAFKDESAAPGPGAGWGPALAATGAVNTFTASSVISGAVWANSFGVATINVTTNNANFELAAGFRADRSAIAIGGTRDIVLYGDTVGVTGANFRSGSIRTLNVALRGAVGGTPAVSGFTGRFVAGMDVLNVGASAVRASGTGANTALDFQAAATASQLVLATPDGGGRISAINVTGPVASGGNTLQFAAREFPAARFNYGTPAVAVTIPSLTAQPGAGVINVAGGASFFRLGIPT